MSMAIGSRDLRYKQLFSSVQFSYLLVNIIRLGCRSRIISFILFYLIIVIIIIIMTLWGVVFAGKNQLLANLLLGVILFLLRKSLLKEQLLMLFLVCLLFLSFEIFNFV